MKLALSIFLIAAFIILVSAAKPKRTEAQTVEDDGTVKTVVTEEWTEEQEFKGGRGRGNGNTIVVLTNDDNNPSENSDHHVDHHGSSKASSFQGSNDQYCTKGRGSFADHCFDKYGGVAHGGQCFFLIPQLSDWTNAWKACAAKGGQLAQVHSQAEFDAISSYIYKTIAPDFGNGRDAIWIALYRDPGLTNSGIFLSMNTVKWYTSPFQPHKMLTAGNTWLRTRANDSPFVADWLCMVIWDKGNKFGINPCTLTRPALCQVTNENQEFTHAPNQCVAEVAIEQGPGSCPDDCAKGCAKYGWCRSFNFRKNNRTCEYFSWSIQDGPKLMNDKNCQHFSYQ